MVFLLYFLHSLHNIFYFFLIKLRFHLILLILILLIKVLISRSMFYRLMELNSLLWGLLFSKIFKLKLLGYDLYLLNVSILLHYLNHLGLISRLCYYLITRLFRLNIALFWLINKLFLKLVFLEISLCL